MKTLMKDKGLTVVELENGAYVACIENEKWSIEKTFTDYEAMQRWIDVEFTEIEEHFQGTRWESGFAAAEVLVMVVMGTAVVILSGLFFM
jgi:hypothetical protein